jgi:hypothetical protein
MYQTFPRRSWAYQSKVRSTAFPCSETVSRTTVHRTPRTNLVLFVTTTSSVCGVPSVTPSKWNLDPGRSGKYALSIVRTKLAGSIVGMYGPRRIQPGGEGFEVVDAPAEAASASAATPVSRSQVTVIRSVLARGDETAMRLRTWHRGPRSRS